MSCTLYRIRQSGRLGSSHLRVSDNKTSFTRAKKSARHAKFLAPCPNNFGTALPIYTVKNQTFLCCWARVQFLNGTPNFRLFFSREMADKQQAIILHRTLSVKDALHPTVNSRLRFKKETYRHFQENLGRKRRKESCFL